MKKRVGKRGGGELMQREKKKEPSDKKNPHNELYKVLLDSI